MAFATLNGLPVVSAYLHFPLTGVWTVDARLAVPDASRLSAGPVVFATSDGKVKLVGTLNRGGVAYDTGLVSAILGAGGMGKPATPKAYRYATRATVLADLLGAAGERLATDSTPGVVNQFLTAWSVLGGHSVGTSLNLLLAGTGAYWRSRPDGTIWVGTDSYAPVSRPDATVLDVRPQQGDAWIALDSLNLGPGVAFLGQKVTSVTHEISEQGFRSHLVFSA